jgi:hypothetical protein
MCKPLLTNLTTELPTGPCGFKVRSYSDACAAFSLGETWRIKLANVLRRLADKAEGVQSLSITAYGPSHIISYGDFLDAVTMGIDEGTRFLNDLWRDRVLGSDSTRAEVIRSTQPAIRQ